MTNEKCRSKRRCLPSLLRGLSPLVMIAEHGKSTKEYSADIKLSYSESNEEMHSKHPSRDGWVLFRLLSNLFFVLPKGVKIYFLYLRRRNLK